MNGIGVVVLQLNLRGKKDDSVIIPTLNALSTGQSALFNMFATIVRYSDMNDINYSVRLSDIKGIVVIDEIELHLHSN
jgi:predicted ATP-binding protein involved in virulence